MGIEEKLDEINKQLQEIKQDIKAIMKMINWFIEREQQKENNLIKKSEEWSKRLPHKY